MVWHFSIKVTHGPCDSLPSIQSIGGAGDVESSSSTFDCAQLDQLKTNNTAGSSTGGGSSSTGGSGSSTIIPVPSPPLSAGAIAGIAIGPVAVIVAGAAVGWCSRWLVCPQAAEKSTHPAEEERK
jgi:hypothetical protein